MPKKRRVPEVLWRLFRDQARTLSTTITSFISPHVLQPSQSCLCKTHLCLSCCGSQENAISFLLRPQDPADYRNLLSHCFVVVHDNAPPFGAAELHNWPQHEIVVRTIEVMIREQSSSVNVICSGYDKFNHSSPIVELLTSSAWALLLKRVGDNVMLYLLKHTSIFLPLPPKKYHQVTGPPVTDLAFKLMKHAAQPESQDPSFITSGNRKKRSGISNANSRVDIQQHSTPSVQVSSGCVGCNDRKYIKPSRRHPPNKYDKISVSETASEMIGSDFTKHEELPNGELINQRKRSRPLRWEQCKKPKHSNNDDSCCIRAFNRYPAKRDGHPNILETVSSTIGTCSVKHGGSSNEEHNGLNPVIEKPKKKSRLFGWLRGKKRRYLDDETACDNTCFLMDTIEENAIRNLQFDHDNRKSHSNRKMPQQCSCCHVLQASHLVTKGAQINRQPIFYNSKQYLSVLPQKHMLYSLYPNFSGSKSLVGSIFGLSTANINGSSAQCSHSSDSCLIGSACLYHSLTNLLKILIHRSHHCNHVRLLDKHLMISSQTTNKKNLGLADEENDPDREVSKKSNDVNSEHCIRSMNNRDQIEEVKSYCSKSQVVSFIWAVCRNLVPPDLLGTPSNWRILTRNIARFIQLRRFEKFSLKQCVHNLKVSEFPFLSDKHCLCHLGIAAMNDVPKKNLEMHKGLCELNDAVSDLKHKLLEKWIFWFFQDLVVPLLQTHFYVTESDHGKQEIFYYRKLFWEGLKNKSISSLKDQNYQYVSTSVVDRIISNRSFGFSKLRLLPKENGVRMLANLKAPSRMLLGECSSYKRTLGKPQFCRKSLKYKHFKSVNCVLRDTYAVLKGIQLKEPDKLGSSVFDYNDIYGKLCLFMIGLKNGGSTMPNVFIVISDVSKAFDSVDQDKLLRVMKDVIVEDEYLLQQSSQVVSTKKSFWVNQNLILADSNLSCSLTKLSSARFGSLHTLLVNQGLSRYIKKEKLFFNLNEHVKHNILQLNEAFYLQGIGIPQGSILSSLLCSLYYGHLERNVVFPFLEKTCEPTTETSSEDRVIPSSCYTLLRLIDDFCFISTSKEQAAGFYTRLRRGFRDYNCYMNEKKFCINFDSGHASLLPSNRIYVGEDGISFLRWSGLLLNSCTLEVQADYTRYLNSHLRSTLTISWQGKPAARLKAKLRDYMRPKCHPIFFDSNINSSPVVRLNIYQAFLVCAMKFHCYVSEMLYMCKLRPRFYLKIIARSFRYMYMLIKKMMCSRRTSCDFKPILELEEEEVEWLGLNAFIKVLKRKQSRHGKLLDLLKLKLLVHKINGNNVSSQLKYAVDSSHSSAMWKIKY
ncbi:telomerase reverse transcriptase [Euphorbia lathyris]|uniref:telomerase reverse transcriptase n=1 Tax=Euphorbia lathyris TaxID=212925 RepID=UPI00331375B8